MYSELFTVLKRGILRLNMAKVTVGVCLFIVKPNHVLIKHE